MSHDLDFQHAGPLPPGGAVVLDFGHRDRPPPADVVTGALRVRFGRPKVRLRALYDNQASRKLEGGGRLQWERAQASSESSGDVWADARRARGSTGAGWVPTLPQPVDCAVANVENERSRSSTVLVWSDAADVSGAARDGFDVLLPAQCALAAPWQRAQPLHDVLSGGFVSLVPQHHGEHAEWSVAARLACWRAFRFAPGVWMAGARFLPWQDGWPPPYGESHWPVDPPPPPPPVNSHPTLDFRCPAKLQGLAWQPSLPLAFSAHPCPGDDTGGPGDYTVPVLSVYFVSNSVEVVRLPGREPVPVRSLQVGIDAESWAWGLSASLPYAALELIEPTADGPVELEIAVNGIRWTMAVEGYDVHREFGQASLSVRARSPAAYLADPYAPKRSFVVDAPFNARQLAEQELDRPGLATGFTLDWQLPDWLVPAGAWSYEALTPMAVVSRIAEAVGGYVNADARLKTLHAKPRYPALPWEWATKTPDRTLPLDIVKTLDLRWTQKPAFNAVMVSGERHGLAARVFRSGTAGDAMAPSVVDALLTHADACRERGRSILADTGRQATVTLELPMLDALGLIDPGQLVAVGDGAAGWRGLVRSTHIAAEWSQSLTVRQTIELERHYL